MTITRRAVLTAGTTLAAGLAAPTFLHAEGLETTTLSLGFGIDLPFALHVVAINNGWFAEAGFTEVRESGRRGTDGRTDSDLDAW
jgi:ABC-type nitrate/sulfonate/bicarbonate transport system substrate-binding protein